MKPPKDVFLVSAQYVKDYIFRFTFSNGKESVVDFEPILTHSTGIIERYLDIEKFKKIKIFKPRSHIYWGKDWDMCFPIGIYYGETQVLANKQRGGRKPLADKKVLLRLYVRQSIVKANGGEGVAQEKATKFLEANAEPVLA